MRIEPTSMRKKLREPFNVTKELSYMMLELHNMKPSNIINSKGTIKCEKRTVTCDIGTAQCDDKIVKCEKKKKKNYRM